MLAIVLPVAILARDSLRIKRQHGLLVRMHQNRPRHLVIVFDPSILVRLAATVRTAHLAGTEDARPIDAHQIFSRKTVFLQYALTLKLRCQTALKSFQQIASNSFQSNYRVIGFPSPFFVV